MYECAAIAVRTHPRVIKEFAGFGFISFELLFRYSSGFVFPGRRRKSEKLGLEHVKLWCKLVLRTYRPNGQRIRIRRNVH